MADLARATQLLQAGRVIEAIAAFKDVLAARPDQPDAWYNLGYLHRVAAHYEDAVAAYDQALAHGVAAPEEVQLNRAVILADHLDEPEAAAAALAAAVDHNPSFLPAWLNLGMLREDLGDRDAARAAYRQALTVEPGNGRALARLAGLDVFEGDAEAAIARLTPALSAAASPDDAAELGFALGGALDAVGRYGEAFATIVAANAASRASAPGLHYDPGAVESLIDALIAAYPMPTARTSDWAPVFVLGMFRSGSTLVEQILGAHPQVTAGGELEALPALVQQLQPYPEATIDPAAVAAARVAYLDGVQKRFPNAAVLTDKRPDNFLHIGLIKAMFPGAKIVHTRRDPRDTIISAYFLHFQHSVTWGLDLSDAAHWYSQYRRLMAHWQALYPDDVHDIDYEAIVAEPRGTIAALLEFLGLPWDDACLAFHSGKSPVRTASVWQVRKPLHDRSVGRWRHYRTHLGPLADL